MSVAARSIVIVLILASVGPGAAKEPDPIERLIEIQSGNLPIILSAPHGGTQAIPGVSERRGIQSHSFVSRTDIRTNQLASATADELERRLGKRPYLVTAKFHRKYLDVNRRETDAYESIGAKSVYDAYHNALRSASNEVVRRWGHGLLVDFHGQSGNPTVIFRGTDNGKTTSHLVNRFGKQAVIGRASLLGRIASQGLPVIPPVDSKDREDHRYDGGYIVRTYGSAFGSTIDAIQLEIGKDFRGRDTVIPTAIKLAHAIAGFANDYLPKAEWDHGRDELVPNSSSTAKSCRVAVYQDVGAGQSTQDLLDALGTFDGITFRPVTADEIQSGVLSKFDVLIHPGGSGSKQGRRLGESGRKAVRQFLSEGGGLIGICAGAYLASADYPWSLHVLDAKVMDKKHWARGTGMVDIRLTESGKQFARADNETMTIFYGQGPLLAPKEIEDLPDYESLATYKTEIRKNGAPEGVMKGTTAIARGSYGQGRVLCFSPHPEKTEGLHHLIRNALSAVHSPRTTNDRGKIPSRVR